MAKSLRSKWKRKMRAVKRERYGEKEKDRLIKMLTAAGETAEVKVEDSEEVTEIPARAPVSVRIVDIRKPTRRPRVKPIRGEGRKSRKQADEEEVDEEMESDDGDGTGEMTVDKPEHVFSKRTMRDQFGNYPAWMNKRKMHTQQKKNKRIAKRRALSLSAKRRK